ncbi:uncharacterized protein MEPE_03724 [Melanopsichium pennsylvanicum]|uniref:Uncharacterized protein n=1 Tax=Melanopsichium pennsylvanicum TaxID=63383 RepID=A0AAJ4XML9_9BASI|nr:uncharacterized protein MEPE_03724 [Melanopsichium pennsylvanicum]
MSAFTLRLMLMLISTLLLTAHPTQALRTPSPSSPTRINVFNLSKVPRYDFSKPSGVMKSYTLNFPSSSPLVSLSFDGDSRIFVLTMLGKETPDNRLTHTFIAQGLLPALKHVEQQWNNMLSSGESDQGAALISTGGTDASAKIFSNGLDFEKAVADPRFFDTHLNALYEKLLTFPIPTIAAVNGHAFAAGFGLACTHDYRIMNAKRGYMCMNEIDFGAPLPHGLQQALASKISDQKTMRKIVLEGHRFSAKEALDAGFVDGLSESPQDTLDKAIDLAQKLKAKAKMNAWGCNKEVIYAQAIKITRTKHDDATNALYAPRAKM